MSSVEGRVHEERSIVPVGTEKVDIKPGVYHYVNEFTGSGFCLVTGEGERNVAYDSFGRRYELTGQLIRRSGSEFYHGSLRPVSEEERISAWKRVLNELAILGGMVPSNLSEDRKQEDSGLVEKV